MEENIRRLVKDNITVDPSVHIVPTTFYSAYHGKNNRSIAEKFGRIYQSSKSPAYKLASTSTNRTLRVGLISKYFCRHTIGRLNLGTVQQLDRDRFDVIVVSAQSPSDPFAEKFREAADEYVILANQPKSALEHLKQLQLDILFFPDVGMDPFTYSLAFSRSAPIQCVTWGHPVTTGSPVMDYFISSEHLEIAQAQDHYTECLIQLPELAVCYERPSLSVSAPSRTKFGFSNDDNLYGCLQTLFKFHTEFDGILASILRQDPKGKLVLIEGRHPTWTERLRARLAVSCGDDIARVHFLPRLSWADFMGVCNFVDVLLDPIHFGGGNTTYEALALGKPVVTWPGEFLRSRISLALMRKMGFEECVVNSSEEYVRLAVRLGQDRDYREHVSSQILQSCPVLYDDVAGIRQLEDFWETDNRRGCRRDVSKPVRKICLRSEEFDVNSEFSPTWEDKQVPSNIIIQMTFRRILDSLGHLPFGLYLSSGPTGHAWDCAKQNYESTLKNLIAQWELHIGQAELPWRRAIKFGFWSKIRRLHRS